MALLYYVLMILFGTSKYKEYLWQVIMRIDNVGEYKRIKITTPSEFSEVFPDIFLRVLVRK